MNPYQYPVSCSVCGGGGVGTVQTAAAAWVRGNVIAHTDPRICRDVLRAKEHERTKHLATPPPSDWVVPA